MTEEKSILFKYIIKRSEIRTIYYYYFRLSLKGDDDEQKKKGKKNQINKYIFSLRKCNNKLKNIIIFNY